MTDGLIGLMIVLCALIGGIAGYQICKSESVDIDELRLNGYDIIRHSETHGSFHTNWVEVVRKDGRKL